MKSFFRRLFASLLLSLTSTVIWAWDSAISGVVDKVDVAPGQNYGFRVYLKGAPAMCGNTHNWAYLNEADSNYKTFVATLLMAKTTGSGVVIYSTKDSNGYCQIGYMTLS
jgi:hypothetical protein